MKNIILIPIAFLLTFVIMTTKVSALPQSPAPVQYTLNLTVTAKSSGTSNNIKQIVLNGTAAASQLRVGDTIVIDINGQYEMRDISAIKTTTGSRTQIDFIYPLEYNHNSGAIVQLAYSTTVVFDSSVKTAANETAGITQIQVFDSQDKIKVGDSIIINPNGNPDTFEITGGYQNDTIISFQNTAGLSAGDKIVLVNSANQQETVVIKSVDNETDVTLETSLQRGYPEGGTAFRYKIEKAQIIGITNGSPKTFTLKAAIKYNHSANEPVILTNTASSMYEHDSGFQNNQSQGNQPQGTLNPSVASDGNQVTGPLTGGPHGKYTSNTNACGRCHQLHSAPSPKLVRFDITMAMNATNPIYATCTFCHNFNGQSTYDVKNGQIWDTYDGKRYATNGGGFERMLVVEGDASNATLVKVTSKHRVDTQAINNGGTYTFVKFNAPGGYSADGNGHVELTCTKCHQPHGTRNGRQLVESVKTKDQNGNDVTRNTFDGSVRTGAGNGSVIIKVENPYADEKTKYSIEIVDFCGSCHYDYAKGDGTKNGVYSQKYRHKMAMPAKFGYNDKDTNDSSLNVGLDATNIKKLILPTASQGAGGQDRGVICTTCHFAHGTFTTTDGVKQYDDLKLNTSTTMNTVGGWETSKNLRLDNRGVCQNCHNRQADSTIPSLVDILNPNSSGSGVYGTSQALLSGQKAGSFTDNSIMIRFSQYMWTDPDVDPNRFTSYPYDIENPNHYAVTKNGSSLPVRQAKLQPDGRTVILYFDNGVIGSGDYSVMVNGGADLNWNKITNPLSAVSFTK